MISDTHGQMRADALAALAGCDLIVHAGDVGDPSVLAALGEIAPVHAVRGNIDGGDWAQALPIDEVVRIAGHDLYVIHNIDHLMIDPVAAGFAAVITGHSHHPGFETRDGVLYLNPGSAGPRRFDLPIVLARFTIGGNGLAPEIVILEA